MPPKGRGNAIGGPRPAPRGGFARETYNWVTSADNRSVVTSLAFFAGGVAFLSSSWAEILLPPYDFHPRKYQTFQHWANEAAGSKHLYDDDACEM
ncbi:hypothetical protein CBER1_03881 [Cercospora berteroae]|uniref:Uncharacterized protein n=1 Tax=Cercospora berteroae TaxID=357750 RepID=A0A2S6CEB4_9PEZI|nr:hypothetical protein CBER1_03881 [Cercospora berteroae]